MRVKRLEIQGFKSFKDKTVIHFDEGITGIVGPNGCGKSNIVDAFFWVMGEQSYKHMRGSGSEDLIFNGSSKYSPLGMAEATLVMETDVADTENAPSGATVRDIPVHLRAKEVSVTRRLYRGGEGEYFINGVQARLKDIQELFMDTGVGAKGYSVIEQGQIGKIVNAKPEERRLLVEEAAGIAKYKARKKESIRKMEATESNLSRLNDVIQEIERNLGSLERQAQKARLYRKYKDELLDKELTWGRRKIQVIRQKLETLRKQKETLEQDLLTLRTELQTTENGLETDRTEQLSLTQAAEELQSQVQKLSDELTREQSALELSRRRRGDLKSQLESLEGEKATLAISIEDETRKLTSREEEVSQADQTLANAAGQAGQAEEEVRALRREADEVRARAMSARRELMEKITRNSELVSREASLAMQIEGAEAQVARISQQTAAQSAKLAELQTEAERLRESTESLRSARDAKDIELKRAREAIQQGDRAHRDAIQTRDQSMKAFAQVRSRLQSLEELDQANEGYGDGPKAALDWARSNGQGTELLAIADAFSVESDYESALGGWLENRLESLISGSAATALSALRRLSEEKQGRAAIQLMSEGRDVRSSEPPTQVLEETGFQFIGTLSEKVGLRESVPGSIREAAAAMIDRVCVVASMDGLERVINEGKLGELSGWSLVSLDGTAFHVQEGYLSGGSLDANAGTGVLRRKRAIEELKIQVATAESAHAAAEAAVVAAQTALETARTEQQTAQAELQASEISLATAERDSHQIQRALRDAEGMLELFQTELSDAREDAERSRQQRMGIADELAGFEAAKAELEKRAQDSDIESTAKDSLVREKEEGLSAARVSEAQLRERVIGLKRDLETGRGLIEDRKRRVMEIERMFAQASNEQAEFTGSEVALEERIVELTRVLAEAREQLASVKDRIEQTSARVNAALDRIKQLHKSGDEKVTETNSLALELEKLASEDQHLLQNLEEKYGPGCLDKPVTSPIQDEMTEPVVTAEMTAEEERELGDEVERLRERIRRLGEVNVVAIEEYEELKKRYDHITTEKADLERSIENLKDAIEHINKTSEDRFKKAFEAIAERFERLFPIVFGGGQAKLSLMYPEGSQDILEAGVDILAQPPGKKIQNITLLSGGEKALTAVSLIFAIFMVKPSPFCLLDEVDAPLDDANIGKFNALLKEMSAKSQFILITHNKKTMELNDTLYGVTMEEPGVSKMVSIQMQ